MAVLNLNFKLMNSPVVGIDLHPMGDLLISASHNGEWAVHDLVAETTIAKFKDDVGNTLLDMIYLILVFPLFGFTS